MAKSYKESLLGTDENILHAARQHWFILIESILVEIVLIILMIALTIGAGLIIKSFLPDLFAIVFLIGAILLIMPMVTLIRDIFLWLNKEFIITNLRVIQISGIFNKNVTDSSLEKVNDVHMEQSFFGRMFNFGDIEILTASELGVNLFRRIEDPIRFKTTMLNAKQNLEHGTYTAIGEAYSGNIPSLLQQLDNLRQKGVLSEEEFQQKKTELLSRMK